MKLTVNHLNAILLAGIIIFMFVLMGRSSRPAPDYSGQIKALEQLVDEKQAHLETYRAWKDEEIRRGLERDSLLAISYINHQKSYTPIYEQLKKIPDRIAAIAGNDDSIRAAFAR